MNECKHPNRPHTVWWWEQDAPIDHFIPVPLEARYDNRADAVAAAIKLRDDVEAGRRSPLVVKWIKVFRSDNESYTCWRWPEYAEMP